MKIEELRIPAPWGHIAAKCHGDPSNEIVIVLHGYLDNAGSFDRLIPKMPEMYYYVCADLPGHGFSSGFDSSLPTHYLNFLLPIKVITNYFKRDSYVLLGHSFGATLCIMFTQLYPKTVSKLIMLDALYVIPIDAYTYMNSIRFSHLDYFEKINNGVKRNGEYKYDEIINRLKRERYPDVKDNGPAEDIAKRMIKQNENGTFSFTINSLLKSMIMPSFTFEYKRIMFETHPVLCPKLIILTKNHSYNDLNQEMRNYYEEKKYDIREIDGVHHVHQIEPEIVLKHIVPFLLNQSSKY
ncbi:serine hydrolase-like protein 2 isoform X1 [Onthophagus taurus]|uniref:serine hydrolase-like protein 2 isoform X1 n=1 Tax=Onthophagus taurus TaxID=166361 RepID=UPI0039BEBDE2